MVGSSSSPPPGAAFRVLIGAAAFVVVVGGLRSAASLVVPLFYAVFLAILVGPPLGWLRHRGFSALSATIIVSAGIVVVALLTIPYVAAPVAGFVADLPRYRTELRGLRADALAWVGRMGVDVSDLSRESEYLNTDDAVQYIGSVVSSLGDAFANGLLILFLVIFLLAEAAAFPAKLRALPQSTAAATLDRLQLIIADVRGYMMIKTWISLINGGFVALWCLVIGVQYPALWGLLTFLTNFIPNIGALIAAVPTVLVATVDHGLATGALMAAGFLLVELVSGYVIEPRWTGQNLGISTLVVFLSLVFWGWVLGPAGMLLSVPLTIAVKIALESDPSTRWLAVLLGSQTDQAAIEQTLAVPPARVPIARDRAVGAPLSNLGASYPGQPVPPVSSASDRSETP